MKTEYTDNSFRNRLNEMMIRVNPRLERTDLFGTSPDSCRYVYMPFRRRPTFWQRLFSSPGIPWDDDVLEIRMATQEPPHRKTYTDALRFDNGWTDIRIFVYEPSIESTAWAFVELYEYETGKEVILHLEY